MYFAITAVILAFVGQSLGAPWDPTPGNSGWMNRHNQLVAQTKQHAKEEKIVFIGDSITDFFPGTGKKVWDKYYASRHAFNYGISGDRTENVVYRIVNKEFDGVNAKVAVLMIGTNNLGSNSVQDIARGVQEILKLLEAKMPNTKIILLGVLPRNGDWCSRVRELNVLIEKFGNNKNVFWLNMWNSFASNDCKLKDGLFRDGLHPTEAGYQVWQETMEPLLKKLDPNY